MMRDVVSFGETMLRLTAPESVRLEEASTLQVYVAGSESNTLAALARLKLNVAWLSALPNTPAGRHVENELRGHGIDTSHVVWSDNPARLGTFYVEQIANPLGLQVYYDRANSACALIDPDKIDYTLLDDARILHLTGITSALSQNAREVYQRLLQRAREQQVPLSFDVNYRAKLWSAQEAATQIEEACQQAQILFCAQADAAELWGFSGSPAEILHQMVQRFAQHNSQKTLVLTLGHAGSAQLHGDDYQHEPALPTDGHARFGSGDAFNAGYLYAYLHGPLYQELQQTHEATPLTFGNALAALKRCLPGDIAVITPNDVKTAIQGQKGQRFR